MWGLEVLLLLVVSRLSCSIRYFKSFYGFKRVDVLEFGGGIRGFRVPV